MSMKEDKVYSVYLHTVPKEISGYPNDKYYIGITRQKINRRWRFNGKGYKTQNFYKVIQKYGWDSLKHEILGTNLTHEEACSMEQMYICALQSDDRKYGYNLTSGGDGHFHWSEQSRKKISESRKCKYVGEKSPLYGKKFSEEHIQHMREAQRRRCDADGYVNPTKGNKLSDEQKAKISIAVKEALKKIPNPHLGTHLSEEHRRLISEHHYDISGINNPNSIIVICKNIRTQEIQYFESITQASKKLHHAKDCISRHIVSGKPLNDYMFYKGDKDEFIRQGYQHCTQ